MSIDGVRERAQCFSSRWSPFAVYGARSEIGADEEEASNQLRYLQLNYVVDKLVKLALPTGFCEGQLARFVQRDSSF
jgi:hypothetical protein